MITTSLNIYQTKKSYSNEKPWNNFETPLFLRGHPCFSTNPPISEHFFHDPRLCSNFKNKKPPLILGGENYDKASAHKNLHHLYALQIFNVSLWTSFPLVLLVSRALWENDIGKVVSILTPGLLFSNNEKLDADYKTQDLHKALLLSIFLGHLHTCCLCTLQLRMPGKGNCRLLRI